MKPIEFKEQNTIYQKPESMTDEQCSPLPAHQYNGGIISCWELTPEERQKVLSTGVIWFGIMSQSHPPIWLDAENPFEPQKKEEAQEMILKQEDLTINNLENCFNEAREQDKKYVGVLIQMQGFPKAEIIINENANIQAKLDYYKKAYNDDLTLKSFDGIKIIGFTHGDDFAGIEYDFLIPKE